MMIPSGILKKLYTRSSLKNSGGGPQFSIKNRLSDAEVVGVRSIAIDGCPVALDHVWFDLADGRALTPADVDAAHPIPFPFSSVVTVRTDRPELPMGPHDIDVAFETRPFGRLHLKVEDTIAEDGQRARQPLTAVRSGWQPGRPQRHRHDGGQRRVVSHAGRQTTARPPAPSARPPGT